eukprot:711308-Hanusia_phi.AAC.1
MARLYVEKSSVPVPIPVPCPLAIPHRRCSFTCPEGLTNSSSKSSQPAPLLHSSSGHLLVVSELGNLKLSSSCLATG